MASHPPFSLPGDTPVDIVDGLTLATADYVLSNDGDRSLRLFEGPAAPAINPATGRRHGHGVQPGGTWYFTVGDDEVWVWSEADGTVIVVSSS